MTSQQEGPQQPVAGACGGPIVLQVGKHYVNFDSVASVERLVRDRHSHYGIVIVPVAVLHLKVPILRDGQPPLWRLEAEGPEASVVFQQMDVLAADCLARHSARVAALSIPEEAA